MNQDSSINNISAAQIITQTLTKADVLPIFKENTKNIF